MPGLFHVNFWRLGRGRPEHVLSLASKMVAKQSGRRFEDFLPFDGQKGHRRSAQVSLTPLLFPPPRSRWNTTLQTLVASYEAYEDLMKKSQEGKEFYADLESKVGKLLEKAQAACKMAESNRQQILEK